MHTLVHMNLKEKERARAINMRMKGFSYSEILQQIPVAKSTLSSWLQSVNLSQKHQQRLTEKKLLSAKRGGLARRKQRIEETGVINRKAESEIKRFAKDQFFVAGVMLYWAEGTKQKESNVSQRLAFSNSDPIMIELFLSWLSTYMGITKDRLFFEIFIHTTGNVEKSVQFWSKITGCDKSAMRVYFKKHKAMTNRKRTGEDYVGQLKVNVKASTRENRIITAWTTALCKNWGIV